MAKAVKWYIKLQIKWGQANPAPPVWPALWQHWVAIPEFTKRFNDATKDKMWVVLPVIITVYEDRTFDFIVKQPPASVSVIGKINLKSWSKLPHKDTVWHLTFNQLKELAEMKMPDLNAVDLAWAMLTMDGTARSAWITSDIHWMKKAEVIAKLSA